MSHSDETQKKTFKLGYEPCDFDMIIEEVHGGATLIITNGRRCIEFVRPPQVVQ